MLWKRPLTVCISAFLLLGLAALPTAGRTAFASPREATTAHLSLVHPGYLTVGSDTTYPPMESKDLQHGGFKGADIDLANALAHAMGLKGAKIVSTNFNTIIPTLQRHNFDVIMSSMNDTSERRKQITFVDYMKLVAAEAILVPKASSLHASGYSALCGHSVSVESGTAEQDDLKTANKSCSKKIDVKAYNLDTDAFQAMVSGHTESYTTDLPVALFYVKAHRAAVRFAGQPFGSGAKYGIGMAKNATALRTAIVRALQTIHRNGQYLRILKRYGLGSTAI